nr:MAG TPA: hypothetical protein [Caudoviricetes sp.]
MSRFLKFYKISLHPNYSNVLMAYTFLYRLF